MFLRCLKLLCTGRAKFTLPTPASFPPVPASSGFTPVFVLHPYTRIRSCFRFFPNPVPLLSALLLFSSFTLIPHSLLFPIFPQSRPASSGFTPASVLHYTRIRSCFRFSPNPAPLFPVLLLFLPFTLIPAFALVSDFSPIPSRFFRLYSCFRPLPLYRIRSCFRFSPNPVPLLPALLLLLSFIIPAFALVSDFPPILPRFFRFYSCFCPLPLYPHSLLFPIFSQSCPAFSGFTPVFVLHYTRIRSY